jgi:phenylpropionate dioxygenase-like ring-hydroxylating dioxygenase large terminal subunit
MTGSLQHRDYPLEAWYAAAWDVEAKPELLARTICDTPIVLYRRSDDRVVALHDECWHRMLPLSMGTLVGDELRCGYHGLRYDGFGQCVFMPWEDKPRPDACVRSFPAVERHRLIWLWMGDPRKADPALIPDLHWNDDPGWAADGRVSRVGCNYKLLIDNLLDFSHENVVHGSDEDIGFLPDPPIREQRSVSVALRQENVEAPPFWQRELGSTDNVDRWLISRFVLPSIVTTEVGVAPTGAGGLTGNRNASLSGFVLSAVTPETAVSCNYFWSFSRDFRLRSQALTSTLRERVASIFEPDQVVLEAQQCSMERNPGRDLRNINVDSAVRIARELIEEALLEEGRLAQPR